ncbi:Glycosyltransferase 64 protein C4 [Halocaridina rubra]|uniref:Glycosyltransferase 64 protein C4 n=1 Tax=Halocaridina rubra TaxID=373956 RepID=A0AAN8ZSR6_HALRR
MHIYTLTNYGDALFAFKPREGNWPWVPPKEGGGGDPKYRFSLTSLSHPTRRCIGFARRRVGRGGRVWIDRISTPLDDLWFKTDFRDVGPNGITSTNDFLHEVKTEWLHFCPSSPPEDTDTDVEIDVETVGVPVTLTPDVSLNSTSTPEELNLASAVPSSILMTAEVIDGEYLGNITDLEVSIPSELDTLLSGDSGVILGENLEVDLVTDSNSAVTDSGSALKVGAGTNSGCSGNSGGVTFHDLSNSDWASSFSSTSERQQQHSVNFTTQPTSKFVTLDSTNTLPLAVSGLQLSTSNMTGDEIHSCSLPSSSLSAVASSSSSSLSSSSSHPTSSFPGLSSSSSSTANSSLSSISLSTSSATSLSNSLLCASSSIVNDKVGGSECSTNSECSDSQALLTSSHILQQESLSADALSVSSGLLLSNNKNNGSNVLSSATTNNLVSHKLYASTTRTNDSLPNSDGNSSSTVLTNGPSNSLDSSKCAKVDHYMFHET